MTKLLIPSHGISLDDRDKISSLRQEIKYRFLDFFSRHGYVKGAPGPLIPEQDDSVLFTGAATNTMKPYLHGKKIPDEKLCMVQTCLRTQNVRTIEELSLARWASYFTILGAIAEPQHLDSLSELTWIFFNQELGIPQARLKIRLASRDLDLGRTWQNKRFAGNLEIDAKDPVYYTHVYGMNEVTGRNCNLSLTEPGTDRLNDIGNIIIIESAEKVIAAEIGFGVETFLSNLWGFSSSLQSALIADIIPMTDVATIKFGDALTSSIAILNTGKVRPRSRKGDHRGRILKYYLQAVSYWRTRANFSMTDLRRFSEKFEEMEFGGSSWISARLEQYVSTYEKLSESHHTEHKFNEIMTGIFQLQEIDEHMPRAALSCPDI